MDSRSTNEEEEFSEIDDYRTSRCWRCTIRHWPKVSQFCAVVIIYLSAWAVLWSIESHLAALDSMAMRTVFLFGVSYCVGKIFLLIYIPEALGMVLTGIFFKTSGLLGDGPNLYQAGFIRELSLVTVLILVGFAYNLGKFQLSWVVMLPFTLALMFAEAGIVAILAAFILDLPALWALYVGSLMTITTPNLTVAVIFKLRRKKFNLKEDIQNLILNIYLFNSQLGLIISTQILDLIINHEMGGVQRVAQTLLAIVIGGMFGVLFGLMLLYMPSRRIKYLHAVRFLLILTGSVAAICCCALIGYPSAGPMTVLTLAMTTRFGWSTGEGVPIEPDINNITDRYNVEAHFYLLWGFMKTVTFSLAGSEINLHDFDLQIYGYGTLIILTGILSRILVGFVTTLCIKEYTFIQKVYILMLGLPKGAVQVSVALIAIDLVRYFHEDHVQRYGTVMITITVLAIFITAPLSSVLFVKSASYCFREESPPEELGKSKPKKNNYI